MKTTTLEKRKIKLEQRQQTIDAVAKLLSGVKDVVGVVAASPYVQLVGVFCLTEWLQTVYIDKGKTTLETYWKKIDGGTPNQHHELVTEYVHRVDMQPIISQSLANIIEGTTGIGVAAQPIGDFVKAFLPGGLLGG